MYLYLAQITWMFNELFYQFRQIFSVFITKTYIWLYIAFGWGKHDFKHDVSFNSALQRICSSLLGYKEIF